MNALSVEIAQNADPSEWDALAAALGGAFFHCHAGILYHAESAGKTPFFAKAIGPNGEFLGIAGGHLTRSRIWPFSRWCAEAELPSTPVAGGVAELEERFLRELERTLRRHGVCRIRFASYHSSNSATLLPQGDYRLTERYEYHWDLTRDADDLFSAFGSSRRKQVRRAERRGVTATTMDSAAGLELVETFHERSMQRRSLGEGWLPERVKAARRKLLESSRAQVLVSLLHDTPVGAKLVGVFNGAAYGMVSGSSKEGNEHYSPAHLVWHCIQHYQSLGMRTLSLGGAKADETGLAKFKSQFGTIVTSQPAGSKTLPGLGGKLARMRKALRR